jgi:hypothetical protein
MFIPGPDPTIFGIPDPDPGLTKKEREFFMHEKIKIDVIF